MRDWLRSIDASFSQYFGIIEDNYDTVDQICRLYMVGGKKTGDAKRLDPLFFDDNKVVDPEHQRLFRRWFAREWGVDFVDQQEPAPVGTRLADVSEGASSSTNAATGATASSGSGNDRRLRAADADVAPASASPVTSEPAGVAQQSQAWGAGAGWGVNGWTTGGSWWDGREGASPGSGGANDGRWPASGWGEGWK